MLLDAPAPPRTVLAPELRRTTIGVVLLITMIAFEAMATGPALPFAARALHGVGAYGWAFTGFLVASVVGMVTAGQQGSPRRPLLVGITLFVAGLVVAGTATTMTQLVVARAAQGFAAGLLITAAYVLIGETYPEALRPKVFAATSSAWLVPSLLGPVVAGTVTQTVGWRWVFLGLVPVLVGVAALLFPIVRAVPHRPGTRDVGRLGRAVVVALGVAAVQTAGQHPSPAMIALAAIGLGAVVVGVRGLVPPGTLRLRPGVGVPIAMRGLLGGAFFGAESLLPLMLATQHHLGPTAAGLPLTGAGITWAAGAWYAGRTGARVANLRVGFACVAAAVALVGLVSLPSTPYALSYPAWLLAGLGAGLTMPTTSVLMLGRTNDRDRGRDSAALQLADTTCSSLTTGLAGVLVAAAARSAISYTHAFVALDLAMAAIALTGAATAGRAAISTG